MDGHKISPFPSEDLVEIRGLSRGWLLCFFHLQLVPQYLFLVFNYLCNNEQFLEISYEKKFLDNIQKISVKIQSSRLVHRETLSWKRKKQRYRLPKSNFTIIHYLRSS